jgi:hypothetical protein
MRILAAANVELTQRGARDECDTGPRHPDIEVRLTCEDDNAYAVLGRVRRALQAAGVNASEVSKMWTQGLWYS